MMLFKNAVEPPTSVGFNGKIQKNLSFLAKSFLAQVFTEMLGHHSNLSN